MHLDQVKASLESKNPQEKMRAITALRQYEDQIAVPLLASQISEPELIIRSLAAMGLGHKRTPEGFAVLVNVLQHERDANVRSEAANSLSKYGEQAVPYLMTMSEQDDHWLTQLSILSSMTEFDCPDELYTLCIRALEHTDPVVQCCGLEHLGYLQGTIRHQDAMETLLVWAESENWLCRKQTALTLRLFKELFVKKALMRLRQDEDYRVVAATLEGLI